MKKKFLIIAIICFFINFSFCNAEVQTYDRNEANNYGVNKKWKITNANKSDIINTPLVDSSEKIYDFADILTDTEEEQLYNLSVDFYSKTNMELVIMTDNFYNTTDEENENWAVNFYDYNDFGLNLDNYSGVIIFRNAHDDYPYYGIYTFGEAQFYYMTDRLNNVLDDMYSYMTSEYYLNGFIFAIDNLENYYDKGKSEDANNYYLDENGILKENYRMPIVFAFITSFCITLIVILILVGKNKMVHKATTANDYLDSSSIKFTVRNDQFITSRTTSHVVSSSNGGSGGGGSRIGSSGGGHGGGGRRG